MNTDNLAPLVIDTRDIKVEYFTTGRVGNLSSCDLSLLHNDDRLMGHITDRRTVYDLVCALCHPSPPPYRRDVYDAMMDLKTPFSELMTELIENQEGVFVTLWRGPVGVQVKAVTKEKFEDYAWLVGLVQTIKERGYSARITTNPFPHEEKEQIGMRICIRAVIPNKEGNHEVIITQRQYTKSKKPILTFVARVNVGLEWDNLFVQPVPAINVDGTFCSVDMNTFMGCFITMEDACVLGSALMFTNRTKERISDSRVNSATRKLKVSDMFAIERLDAKDAVNYFDLFGGD